MGLSSGLLHVDATHRTPNHCHPQAFSKLLHLLACPTLTLGLRLGCQSIALWAAVVPILGRNLFEALLAELHRLVLGGLVYT